MDKNGTNKKVFLDRNDCILVVIDMQEKLLPVIAEKETVLENVIKLARFSDIMGLPVLITEQEKLGNTVSGITKETERVDPIRKIHFNCFYCDEFDRAVKKIGRKTLILCGVESHICVTQTALHAAPGFTVHVVSDAVSSRVLENKKVALDRMLQGGAIITSTEMVIYELLEKAGTDEFKLTLPLVK